MLRSLSRTTWQPEQAPPLPARSASPAGSPTPAPLSTAGDKQMADPTPSFRFGDFKWICNHASLTICPALGLGDPQCYSRNIGSKSFLLFQPCKENTKAAQ